MTNVNHIIQQVKSNMDFNRILEKIKQSYYEKGEDFIFTYVNKDLTYYDKKISELSNNEILDYTIHINDFKEFYKELANDVILKRRIKLLNKLKKMLDKTLLDRYNKEGENVYFGVEDGIIIIRELSTKNLRRWIDYADKNGFETKSYIMTDALNKRIIKQRTDKINKLKNIIHGKN